MLGFGGAKRSQHKAREPLHCSFCSKSQADVRKLIAGPTVLICDECVNVCVDIIVDDARVAGSDEDLKSSLEIQARLKAQRMNAERPAEPVDPAAIPDWHVRCGLCQLVVPTEDAIPIENRGVLCEACVVAVQTVTVDAASGDQKKA